MPDSTANYFNFPPLPANGKTKVEASRSQRPRLQRSMCARSLRLVKKPFFFFAIFDSKHAMCSAPSELFGQELNFRAQLGGKELVWLLDLHFNLQRAL